MYPKKKFRRLTYTKALMIFIAICIIPHAYSAGYSDSPAKLSDSDKRKFEYFYLEALKSKQAGKHSDAYNAITHALSVDSTSSAALYEITNYYIAMGKNQLAFESMKKAVEYNSDQFEYKIALANLAREFGMNKDAETIYEELAKKYPDKPELSYYLSEIYTQQGEIQKAIQALNLLENSIGMNESISLQKFRLFTAIEQKDSAFLELEKLSEKFPTEARYPIIIGDLYLDQMQPEKALTYYQKAHQIDPQNPYYIVSMANYYEYMQDYQAATNEIEAALINPKLDVDTKLAILTRYIQMLHQGKKELERANTLFETLMEQHPQETELNMMYGNLLLLENKVEEAKFQFQIVTESSPENDVAWKQLISIALKEDKPEDCINTCNSALEFFPEDPQFHFYKGIAYSIKEEYRQALESYLEGLKVIPDDNPMLLSDFHGQIGDAYYQLDEKDKAYESYDQALKYNERNIAVLNNYAYFLSLNKKDLDKAERMSAQCVKMQPENSTYLDTYAWVFFVKENYSLAKFYIESAINKDGGNSAEIIDHYGDILFMSGEESKAVEQWKKALELGKNTKTLKRKIADKKYYEEENKK